MIFSQTGITYPEEHLGAFIAAFSPGGGSGIPQQQFDPEACKQDNATNEITITAQREEDGRVSTGRLETYGVWSTAQSEEIKKHGYLEVRTTMPAKTDGQNFRGSWPGIWMLGTGIGFALVLNGYPDIEISLHCTNHYGGSAQHPPLSPLHDNTDLSRDPLIAGLEWNVLEDEGKVDLTWWISWFDQISQSWRNENTTKSLIEEADNDYLVFYSSFVTEGFSLIIDLPEGGPMPGTNEVLVDGQPQYMHVSSVKVYGF